MQSNEVKMKLVKHVESRSWNDIDNADNAQQSGEVEASKTSHRLVPLKLSSIFESDWD